MPVFFSWIKLATTNVQRTANVDVKMIYLPGAKSDSFFRRLRAFRSDMSAMSANFSQVCGELQRKIQAIIHALSEKDIQVSPISNLFLFDS